MISSQSVPAGNLGSSLTLTCLYLIKSALYQILSFSYPRHPSNSSSSSSFYSHSSCKFTCLQQTWLLQSLYPGISLANLNTSHQYSEKLSSNQTKNQLQTLSSHLQNTNKSITFIIIFTINFHFRHSLFLQGLLIHLFFSNPGGTEAVIQLPLKRSSRFQRLFPNPSWLVVEGYPTTKNSLQLSQW